MDVTVNEEPFIATMIFTDEVHMYHLCDNVEKILDGGVQDQ